MRWIVEWKEYDTLTKETTTESDFWDAWKDVVRIVDDCMNDTLCRGVKVYQLGDASLSTEDKLILEYCP